MSLSEKPKEHHLAGAVLMILGMLVFPIGDTAAKYLSGSYSTILLSWVRYAIGAATLLPFVFLIKTDRVDINKRMIFEQVLRAILVLAATIFFIAALSEIPIADTVGAYFIAPIIAGILAVFLLNEKLSASKVIATVLGFGGMLMIVRPSASIDIGYIYALLAGACFGMFLIATRWSKSNVPPLKAVSFQMIFGAIVLSPFILFEIDTLRGSDTLLFILVGSSSALANILTISALRIAPASLLAPLAYVEIIGATILGFVVFGDIPSGLTFAGIGVVILGGLLLIERKTAT